MSARIERRLAQAEAAARQVLHKGMRHFVKVTGSSEFFENTVRNGNIHESAFMGIDGKVPDGATLFTAADLKQLEREGWDVFRVEYVDYSENTSTRRPLWG